MNAIQDFFFALRSDKHFLFFEELFQFQIKFLVFVLTFFEPQFF